MLEDPTQKIESLEREILALQTLVDTILGAYSHVHAASERMGDHLERFFAEIALVHKDLILTTQADINEYKQGELSDG